MITYEFTLRLDREVTAEEADALYGVFHDGSIVTGDGKTEIEFTREAPGLAEAIVSAIRDVESIGDLRVTGAGQEDVVSMLDIAHRTKRSREAVRLWAAGKRGPGGFPEAAWESPAGERFWRWPEVARWVREHFNLAVDIEPDEIRWADEILKARQALSDAQRALEAAPDATRDQLGPLLQGCLSGTRREEVNSNEQGRLEGPEFHRRRNRPDLGPGASQRAQAHLPSVRRPGLPGGRARCGTSRPGVETSGNPVTCWPGFRMVRATLTSRCPLPPSGWLSCRR
jgi:hypothetical protein